MADRPDGQKMSPRSPIAFEKIREKSRQKILTSGLELFAVYGYADTAMSQIANKAGISKGLIYNYYASKEILLEAIVNLACDMAESWVVEGRQTGNPREKMSLFIESAFSSLQSDITFWRFLTSIFFQPDISDNIRDRLSARITGIIENIEELLRAIGYKNSRSEARILAATLDGIGMHYLMQFEAYPLEELKAMLIKKYSTR